MNKPYQKLNTRKFLGFFSPPPSFSHASKQTNKQINTDLFEGTHSAQKNCSRITQFKAGWHLQVSPFATCLEVEKWYGLNCSSNSFPAHWAHPISPVWKLASHRYKNAQIRKTISTMTPALNYYEACLRFINHFFVFWLLMLLLLRSVPAI